MSRVAWFGPVLALIAASSAAAPRTPITLSPLSKWNLHYADQSCQLKRTFGDPARPTSLVFERIGPGEAMSMMIFGDPLRARMGSVDARAAFLPFADERFANGNVAETVTDKKVAILWTRVDLLAGQGEKPKPNTAEPQVRDLARQAALRAIEQANAAKVTGIEVTEPGGRKIVLATGPMGKVLQAMRDCAREQLSAWGVDPEVEDRIVKPAFARQPLYRLIGPDDYPREALRGGQQSIVKARLLIGADGKVTRCTSLTPFRAAGFAEVTCKKLEQATFEPAQLADGTKVPSYTVASILFRMP